MLATDIRKDHKAHMKLFGNRLHCTTTILIQIAQTKIPVIYSHTYLTLVWMDGGKTGTRPVSVQSLEKPKPVSDW